MTRRTLGAIVGFLVLAGIVGAACGRGSNSAGGSGGGAERAAPGKAAPGGVARDGSDSSARLPNPAVAVPSLGAPDEARAGLRSGAAVAGVGPKVVKNASIVLQVKDGAFDRAFQRATVVAGQAGGYVASSQSSAGRHRSGTLVLRVPASQFEQALGQLKSLGRIRGEDVSGQDVTSQYVDLKARLKNWQAQEAVLLRLMAKSTSIEDSIRVQQQLQDVQLAIEEIRGQLRVLTDQTDYATISVSIAEAGFVAPKPKEGGASLGRAWHDALDGFVAVIAAVVVGLGYLLPIAALVLVLALAYRWIIRPRVAAASE